MPRLVLLSDTHGCHERLSVPEGDILVHTGDFTNNGKELAVRAFARWFAAQPHPHKVVIAGNHDYCLDLDKALGRQVFQGASYLLDSEVVVEGLRIYGAPWQPEFMNMAFNLTRGPALQAAWSRIPNGVDVLLTHGPPFGVLDRTFDDRLVGCEELRMAVDRVGPKLHVFGHIHESAGSVGEGGMLFVNASTWRADCAVFVVDVPVGKGRARLVAGRG